MCGPHRWATRGGPLHGRCYFKVTRKPEQRKYFQAFYLSPTRNQLPWLPYVSQETEQAIDCASATDVLCGAPQYPERSHKSNNMYALC